MYSLGDQEGGDLLLRFSPMADRIGGNACARTSFWRYVETGTLEPPSSTPHQTYGVRQLVMPDNLY